MVQLCNRLALLAGLFMSAAILAACADKPPYTGTDGGGEFAACDMACPEENVCVNEMCVEQDRVNDRPQPRPQAPGACEYLVSYAEDRVTVSATLGGCDLPQKVLAWDASCLYEDSPCAPGDSLVRPEVLTLDGYGEAEVPANLFALLVVRPECTAQSTGECVPLRATPGLGVLDCRSDERQVGGFVARGHVDGIDHCPNATP